jgi:hypothetical protein
MAFVWAWILLGLANGGEEGFWIGLDDGFWLGLDDSCWLGMKEGFWLGLAIGCLLGLVDINFLLYLCQREKGEQFLRIIMSNPRPLISN